MSELKVLITTNIPSPYMMEYLRELSKYCKVTALFELNTAADRDRDWYGKSEGTFDTVFLNAKRAGNEQGLSFKVLKYLKRKNFDRLIIANPTTPTGIVALLYCRWFKVPFCIQSEGGFQGSGRGIKEKFKKYIMEKADFYLTGMGNDNDYFLAYGANKDTLKRYPFSSFTKKDIEDRRARLCLPKDEIKKELGLIEDKIVLTVGRFSYLNGYGKGYDMIMKVAETSEKNVGFYFVGDDPTDEFVRWKEEKKLTNVHFIGFLSQSELAKYYMSSDLFVIMSRGDTWGLVVNEAMAYGLPVISSNKCVAGLELVQDGENGYVVNTDDIAALTQKIDLILSSAELQKRMSMNNLKKIEDYNIENMTRTIYQYLKEA